MSECLQHGTLQQGAEIYLLEDEEQEEEGQVRPGEVIS